MEGERVIALHPKITADYKKEVATLNRLLHDYDTPEARLEAIPQLRKLILSR